MPDTSPTAMMLIAHLVERASLSDLRFRPTRIAGKPNQYAISARGHVDGTGDIEGFAFTCELAAADLLEKLKLIGIEVVPHFDKVG